MGKAGANVRRVMYRHDCAAPNLLMVKPAVEMDLPQVRNKTMRDAEAVKHSASPALGKVNREMQLLSIFPTC